MASGDSLFEGNAHNYTQPVTLFATFDQLQEGSTPNGLISVVDFDGAVDEFLDYVFIVPEHYQGTTGWTFQFYYSMDGVDADDVQLQFSVRKLVAGTLLTADQGLDTATSADITDTPSGTQDELLVSPAVALAKADMGTPVAGDTVIVRVQRNVAIATNTDDLQLRGFTIKET